MKKRNVICVILCLVLIVAGCIGLYYLYNIKNNKNDLEDNNVGNQIQEKEQSVEKSKDYIISKKVLTDLFSNDQIENGNILKSKNGDITSEKLTKDEFDKNEEEYIEKIIKNKDKVLNIYDEDSTEYVEYIDQEVLNILELSSHMGNGYEPGVKILNLSENGKFSKRYIIQKVLKDIINTGNIGKGYVLKSIDGDITAEKISENEFEGNLLNYINKIQEKENGIKVYVENENTFAEYEPQKILNLLELSTHMGAGFGESFRTVNINGNNIYSKRMIIQSILNDILEKDNISNSVYKSPDGDITSEKLSEREFNENMNSYVDKLESNKDVFSVIKSGNKQTVEFEVEKVLNALGYSTHMGVGIRHGIQKLELN